MTDSIKNAPGWPGIPARWTSSAKSGVGTAFKATSRVWFTLSHGIFNEIYYPRLDQACVRDMGLIVTDGTDFFSEEKRHCDHKTEYLARLYRLINSPIRTKTAVTPSPKKSWPTPSVTSSGSTPNSQQQWAA